MVLLLCLIFQISAIGQDKKKLDSLYAALLKDRADSSVAKTCLRISNVYIRAGFLDSADRYARYALNFAQKSGKLGVVARAATNLSHTVFQDGHPDSAIYFLLKAKAIYYQIHDTARVAGILGNLGIIARSTGDFLKTLDYYFQSLTIAERFHDTSRVAAAFNNIAETYVVLHDTANALKFGLKSVRLLESYSIKEDITAAYFFLATVYSGKHMWDAAIRCQKRAIAMAKRQNDVASLIHAYIYLGESYRNKGDLEQCVKLNKMALKLSYQIGNLSNVPTALMILAKIESGQGQHKEAVQHVQEAWKLVNAHNDLTAKENTSKLMADVYSAAGNYSNALKYHQLSVSYKDSIFQANVMREAAVKAANYENEKAQLLLRKEQEKKDAISREEKHRKNVILVAVAIILILSLVLIYNLKKRFNITSRQKNIIENQQTELLASIRYAKRIQEALLVSQEFLKTFIPNNFILHLPKDIVSGDFYWAVRKDDYIYFALCDCTGHGVPGAFLSLLNVHYLSEAIEEKSILDPGLVLDHVREHLIKQFNDSRDGMDAVIIQMPAQWNESFTLRYAAANGGAVLMRGGEQFNLVRDKMAVGKGVNHVPFVTREMTVYKGDALYLYSDGYADQFGGPNGKKMKQKKMLEAIKQEESENMELQGHYLKTFFFEWKGKLAQVDDVTMVGFRF